MIGLRIEYHNLMEDVVLQYVDAMMADDGGCRCDACRSDVIAYTLNRLPPRYVATDKGRMLSKLESYESQFHTDVIAAISEGIQLVRQHPRHDPEQG